MIYTEQSTLNTFLLVGSDGHAAVTMRTTIIQDVMTCSRIKIHRRFGRTSCHCIWSRKTCQAANEQQAKSYFLLVTSFIYLSTLKMDAIRSSEASVSLYRITRRHIVEVSSLLSPLCSLFIIHFNYIVPSQLRNCIACSGNKFVKLFKQVVKRRDIVKNLGSSHPPRGACKFMLSIH
jgi:hypothetical protein